MKKSTEARTDEQRYACSMRVIRMFKLGRQPDLGGSRRQFLDCGVQIRNQVDSLEPMDPVEACGYDEYRG